MEVVTAKENPDLGMVGEDMALYGGGVIVSAAGIEFLNGELEGRSIGKPIVTVVDAVIAGGSFVAASHYDKGVRKFLVGFGAGATAETVSTLVEVLTGK